MNRIRRLFSQFLLPIPKTVGYATGSDIPPPPQLKHEELLVKLDRDADYVMLLALDSRTPQEVERAATLVSKALKKSFGRSVPVIGVPDIDRSIKFVKVPRDDKPDPPIKEPSKNLGEKIPWT